MIFDFLLKLILKKISMVLYNMSNTIVTGSSQANAEQQAVQLALLQQVAKNGVLTPEVQQPAVQQPAVQQPAVQQPDVVAEPVKKTWKKDRMQILYMFYLALVLVGGLNWGLVAVGYNPVDKLSDFVNSLVNKVFKRPVNFHLNTVVYSLVAVSAFILLIQRDVWLPFLGKSVLPSALVPFKNPSSSDMVVTINTRPNAKVAYWAALPVPKNSNDSDSDDYPDVMTAYGNFSNSGVVMSDENGVAKLPILTGTGYEVPSGKKIPRHVHYRLINEYGMMGRIRTKRY